MTRRRRVTLILLLGLVLMAGAGQATALVTTLVSPPLVPEGESRLGCALINISTQAREVLVSVFSREGQLLESVSFTLAPGPEAVVTVNLDGRTTRIEMPSREETILDATLRSRPDAPYSCTGGVCGTCRARVVSGEVRMDRNYALEPDEVAAGVVLACQSHPVTDEVSLDYDA